MKTIITGIVILLSITALCSFVLAQKLPQTIELKNLDNLPPIYTKVKEAVIVKGVVKEPARYEQVIEMVEPVNLLEKLKKESREEKSGMTDPATEWIILLRDDDANTHVGIDIKLPSYITDADGGTIRLIMQHEQDPLDQVRIIDLHIGTEYHDDSYGICGRFEGRYGWTRQSGGGDYSWILGDGTPHTLANPWGWAWIVDYRWPNAGLLGGDSIRIVSHPHVSTRVILKD